MVVSISTNKVRKAPKSNDVRPRLFFKHLLTLFTVRSQNPPCQGAHSTMNSQDTPFWAISLLTTADLTILVTSFEAPLKVFALSDKRHEGRPLHEEKRLKARRNEGALRLWTSSRWTALVDAQVKRHTYAFCNVGVFVT